MDPYLGEVRLFAFPKIPVNWVACNGQLLGVQEYNALFALLGTTYGGDGQTQFGVPNLNGRVPIGQGAGVGLSPRTISQTTGTETVTLTAADVPAHTHVLQATTAADSQGTLGPTVMFGADTTNKVKHYLFPVPTAPAPTYRTLAPTAVSMQGGGQAHANIMPGMGMNYCMCVVGVWPQNPN